MSQIWPHACLCMAYELTVGFESLPEKKERKKKREFFVGQNGNVKFEFIFILIDKKVLHHSLIMQILKELLILLVSITGESFTSIFSLCFS